LYIPIYILLSLLFCLLFRLRFNIVDNIVLLRALVIYPTSSKHKRAIVLFRKFSLIAAGELLAMGCRRARDVNGRAVTGRRRGPLGGDGKEMMGAYVEKKCGLGGRAGEIWARAG
jgi:hypothetical protein